MSIGSLSIRFDDYYLVWLAASAVAIRLTMSALRTFILHYPPTEDPYNNQKEDRFVKLEGSFLCLWWRDVWSTSSSWRAKDYFQNFLIGLFELAVYPPLIAHMDLAPVGAWITLKTVAQWGEWKTNRGSFNRFLIGNALVIIAAICLATMVHITSSASSDFAAPG
jgi:hypothetical protein